MAVIENIFQIISRAWYKITGSAELQRYEQACITAWSSELPVAVKNKIQLQLGKFDFIRRDSAGLKTIFYSVRDPSYSSWSDEILFSNKSEDYQVFSGVLRGVNEDVSLNIGFGVYLHRGRLSSIEFQSVPTLMNSMSTLKIIDGKSFGQIG